MAPDEVVGRTDWSSSAHGASAAYRANDRAAMAAGRPMEFEEAGPAGRRRAHFRVTKAPLLDGDGAPYAVCGVATDVTERRRIERDLAASARSSGRSSSTSR